MSEVKTLHEPFIGYLRSQGLLWRRSRPDRATTEAKGEPDFLVLENGRVLAIEFKSKENGKLSKDQVFRHAEYARAGCRVFVVRELTQAIELVEAWRGHTAAHSSGFQPEGEQLHRFGQAYFREKEPGVFERVKSA